ncbi:response regulator transcription factor [Nocardioides sp. GXQ0305]|uniref:response regulator transcription factor n=1 Tax=Nocardioides sp. GXQ0305 TaxID=3423912 RepID=UPI003D7D7723
MAIRRLFGKREQAQAAPAPEEVLPEPEPEEPTETPVPVRVVIVDDDPDARDFLRMGLEVGGFDIVGEGGDGPSAVEAVRTGQPDVVLLDLHMPDIGGIELLPQLREAHRPAKFVVVSAINSTHMTEAAIGAGAIGFIEKGVSPRSVNLHLHKVARAGAVRVVRPYPLTGEYP